MRTNPRRKQLACVLLLAFGLTSGQAQDESAVVTIDGLMWSLEMSGVTPWPAANEFCDTLETAGFADWRLPELAELEALYDPDAEGSIRAPLVLDDCCAWSATDLTGREAEPKPGLPDPPFPPTVYRWGFVFPGGITYFSVINQLDGFAMCVREPD